MGTKIGIYSGSFNPIHIGHLALANWLCEFAELDEIWFVITPHNPLKEQNQLLEDQIRLEMARAAIIDYPKFKVCDIEFHLPKPSYTINTLRKLSELYPKHDFHFIMGADNWKLFDRWKDHDVLLQEYKLLIYPRKGYEVCVSENNPNIRITNAPLIEISSTFIREAYEAGKDVRFFLPEGVRPYFQL